MLILFISLFKDANHKYDLNTKWKSFCERHLIARDPYTDKEREDAKRKDDENHK